MEARQHRRKSRLFFKKKVKLVGDYALLNSRELAEAGCPKRIVEKIKKYEWVESKRRRSVRLMKILEREKAAENLSEKMMELMNAHDSRGLSSITKKKEKGS